MANIGQLFYRVPSGTDESGKVVYNTSAILTKDNFYGKSSNLVNLVGTSSWIKLGVQAAPGTQLVINGIKEILIGRTGIYELDGDILIKNLYFIQPQDYVRDDIAEGKLKSDGLTIIEDAMTTKKNSYLAWTNNLADSWEGISATLTSKQNELKGLTSGTTQYNKVAEEIALLQSCLADTSKMLEIEKTYSDTYKIGWSKYQSGESGVYKSGEKGDLENVIIDYIYE